MSHKQVEKKYQFTFARG